MIPVAIFLFLVGAVLARGFRVWILVPITLVTVTISVIVEWSLDTDLLVACGHGFLVGMAPQVGYAFGLFAHSVLLALRSPRDVSVATVSKRRSVDRTG
jgi:hypothetical protein